MDTNTLRDMINRLEFSLYDGNVSRPCTKDDLNKAAKAFANVLRAFVDELEKSDSVSGQIR